MCNFAVIQADHCLFLFRWFWYEFKDVIAKIWFEENLYIGSKMFAVKNQSVLCHFGFGSPQCEFLCLQPLHRTAVGALLYCFATSHSKYYRQLKTVWKMLLFFRFERSLVNRPVSCLQYVIQFFILHQLIWPDTNKGSSASCICFGTFLSLTWEGCSGSAHRYRGNSVVIRGISLQMLFPLLYTWTHKHWMQSLKSVPAAHGSLWSSGQGLCWLMKQTFMASKNFHCPSDKTGI